MNPSEHSSALGRWQSVYRDADPRLRACVHGYFASSSQLPAPVRERHLPSAEIPLLLNFGAPHRRQDGSSWTAFDNAWVVGLHARHQVAEADGERHFMVVRFTPIGAHLFLRVPMHLIADRAVDLASIDPGLARLILGRVGVANSWAARFDAMESLIAERIDGMQMPGPVDFVWRKLVASGGRAPLGAIASGLDCSHRTLITRFRTSVGIPPKAVARLLRFNRAVTALDKLSALRANESAGKPYIESAVGAGAAGAIAWSDLAAGCGYFDQAHFIREFREFAGDTPAAFLRHVSSVA